jgi:uncharacterized protein (DUF1778 family)
VATQSWPELFSEYAAGSTAPTAALLLIGVHCAYSVGVSVKAERLHLRVDAEQKALLEAASAATGASVSTFVLAAATEAAADVLADRRVFVLDQQAWRVFDEALARPPGDVAGLRELLTGPTVLDAVHASEDE